MEISTDVRSHVVITMQGSHYFINERLNSQLERMSLDDMLTTPDGVQIKVSTIVEVLPASRYYEQYPDKKPAQRLPSTKDLPGISWNDMASGNFPGYSEERRKRAREGLAKGLQKFIDRQKAKGIATHKAQALLEQIQSKARVEKYKLAGVSN